MKSERRHDLETNELAIRMQEWIDRLKPYASQIGLVLLGLVVLAYIAAAWGGVSAQKEEEAWAEYTLASYSTDPELRGMKLLAENEDFGSTPVREWAYLAWANRQVLLASQTYLTDRASTTERLEGVQQVFETLADNATHPQVQDRAQFGLAQVYEMLGKVDEAKAAYDRVKGDLSPLADARVEELSDPDSAKAIEWLASAPLPVQTPASTSNALGGTRPDFEAEVPAPVSGTNPLSTTRSMQDILSEALGPSSDTDRYGEAAEEASVGESDPTEAGLTEPEGETSAPESEAPESAEIEAEEADAAESVGNPETGSETEAAAPSLADESPAEAGSTTESTGDVDDEATPNDQ